MIEPAELGWRDGQPYSRRFQDIYHDPDGTGEVERVFLAPVDFRGLLAEGRPIRVGELGFGTALNFAVVARHALAAGVPLQFVSFEAQPLSPADFDRIAAVRHVDEPVYAELRTRYPPLLHGWHRRRLAGGRVTLSVFYGQAEAGLVDLVRQPLAPFDLWLLDGFAPDRNPAMWSERLLEAVGRTAAAGTRVSTFTAAGRVRRGLAAAGFAMRRVDQRPHKRESLAGTYQATGLAPRPRPDRVTVVGGGIAGAAVARELAESGTPVTILDGADSPASGASAVPATVMHPRLHHDGSPAATVKALAYAHATAAVLPFVDEPGSGIQRTGALQVASPNYPPERLERVAERYGPAGLGVEVLSPAEAADRAGCSALRLAGPVLWIPHACLVNTPRFTRTLLEHPDIEVRTGQRMSDWPGGIVVLACGADARTFSGAGYLELGRVHGQLDLLQTAARTRNALRVPVVGKGYVAPLPEGHNEPAADLAAGATYEYAPWPVARATEQNLGHVTRLGLEVARPVTARKAERSVTSDRNPILGPLFSLDGQVDGRRLVSVGHGSMGTVTCHLGAALIDALLMDGFEPLTAPEWLLVSSLRFRQRQARRGYRLGATP